MSIVHRTASGYIYKVCKQSELLRCDAGILLHYRGQWMVIFSFSLKVLHKNKLNEFVITAKDYDRQLYFVIDFCCPKFLFPLFCLCTKKIFWHITLCFPRRIRELKTGCLVTFLCFPVESL